MKEETRKRSYAKYVVDLGERGSYDKRNKLNDLTSKEWIKFTKSWMIHYPPPRKEDDHLHPAKFPEKLAKEFIEFFTKEGQIVLDPFLGTGSTLVACAMCKRKGIGIELLPKYANTAKKRVKGKKGQKVITADSKKIDNIWKEKKLSPVDFIITSPPYGPMLNKKVGEVQRKRTEEGLDLTYSTNKADIGNIKNYDAFIKSVSTVFKKTKKILKKKGYLVVVLQNYRDGTEYKTLAWDLGVELKKYFSLKGEKLWLQDNKTLFPYGYRWGYIPNVHHHYCLIFQKE